MQNNLLRSFPSTTFIKYWSTCLEELNLNDNQISALPLAVQIKKLTSLTVISSFSSIKGLILLQSLELSNNRLTEAVSVGALTSLKFLDLSGNGLPSLPKDILWRVYFFVFRDQSQISHTSIIYISSLFMETNCADYLTI